MKKISIYIFLVVFIATLTYKIVSGFSAFDDSKEIALKNNQTYVISKKLKSGCYEVGFYSKDKLFYSPLYSPYIFQDSKFEVIFFNQAKKELEKKVIDNNSRLQHGFNPGRITSKTSNVVLDLFKVPLKGFRNIKVLINVKQLNPLFKNKKAYLYFRKYAQTCDIKHLDMIDKKYTYPINKRETNTTLIPLYKALMTKNTQKVKTILDKNVTLCNSNFVGNRTAFHYSAFLNDIDTLTYLVKRCTSKRLDKPDILSKTPLHYAIENNATKVLDFLFEHGGKCPDSVENIYLKHYVGGGIVYEKGNKYHGIENFVVDYNLPEIANILAKNQCIDVDQKLQEINRMITWIYWMKREMENKEEMKRTNDPRWKSIPDYIELIKVFKKYSKNTNTTKRINDGK
jgi:ankyrin repeat protein